MQDFKEFFKSRELQSKNLTYEDWFDAFKTCLKSLGYKGKVYKELYEDDYQKGRYPYDIASNLMFKN